MSNIRRLSPEPLSSTVEEDEISAGKLASILTSAVIDNEVDEDGHIYATDGLEFPVWIEINRKRKLLYFFTYHSLDVEAGEVTSEEVASIVNDLNGSLILTQFNWNRDRLWGHYWMTFDTRVDPRHFVKMLRAFSSVFIGGARDLAQQLVPPQEG
jgi:hypothetical protein